MVKKSNPPDLSGEVVLIPKSAIPPVKPIKPAPPPPPPKETTEISATRYEREVRPKKELSEKQRANLDKLIEANKKRALERRAVVKEIPESIPEDSVLVKVKPKRAYNRKPKEEPKNEVVVPETETDDTDYEPEPVRRRPTKPKKPVKAKPVKPVKKTYRYDTETTSQDESTDSDSDDDEKVQKYGAKVEKRLEAVRSIDQRLQQIKNPYAGKLSIF
jgi:hypothetical protein